ncbi:MAG: hypothetical protein ACRDNB_07580 [Gaiellaceae bacterium]
MRGERSIRERTNEFLIRRVVNTKARLARLLRPGSLWVLGLVTLTGVGAVLKETDVPRASFWKPDAPAGIAFAVVAALSYVGYCLVVIGYRRVLKNSDEDARLYTACRDVAALVERETDIPRDRIGVHVWTIRGWPGMRRLERRATFVPVDRPRSAITWSKGKGVLGQCWLRDDWILADLERLSDASTEREFYAIPRRDRFLFTWHDAKATRHYKAVLAWPLHGGPENAKRVVGVLSVDVQTEGGVDALDTLWTTKRQDLVAHLAVCEAILGRG